MNTTEVIIFIEKETSENTAHYCQFCFYNTLKKERLEKYSKPLNTKCYKGMKGYYIKINEQ